MVFLNMFCCRTETTSWTTAATSFSSPTSSSVAQSMDQVFDKQNIWTSFSHTNLWTSFSHFYGPGFLQTKSMDQFFTPMDHFFSQKPLDQVLFLPFLFSLSTSGNCRQFGSVDNLTPGQFGTGAI